MDATLHAPQEKPLLMKHSAVFKAEIVAACLMPGASVSVIAHAHQLHPSLVYGWIRKHRDALVPPVEAAPTERKSAPLKPTSPTLIPVQLDDVQTQTPPFSPPDAAPVSTYLPPCPPRIPPPRHSASPPGESIHLELRQGNRLLNVIWPAAQADACASWLRELTS